MTPEERLRTTFIGHFADPQVLEMVVAHAADVVRWCIEEELQACIHALCPFCARGMSGVVRYLSMRTGSPSIIVHEFTVPGGAVQEITCPAGAIRERLLDRAQPAG